MEEIKPGRYQHFKGKLYEVLALARHSETLEEYVVYQALYDSEEFGERAVWIRPKEMFCQKILVDGKQVPRFRQIA